MKKYSSQKLHHITVCTVMQNCCKGDSSCQWNTPIFRPSEIENPWTSPHMQTLVFLALRMARVHIREIVIIGVYFLHPRYFFTSLRTCTGGTVWPIFAVSGSKDMIQRNLRPFRVADKKWIFSTIYRKKTRKSLFPQCKTSISNNSGSIKDRAVRFAYIKGFSAMADRMVWPPSLSHDRKWPHPPIRRKTAPWPRVTPVAYKLELSIMGQKMCIGIICISFAAWTENFNTFTIFCKNKRNFLFTQCKTLIGNNSGSIKDRAMQFAYSRGFSGMADQMVWPPSLSHDRKWPRPPIQRKTALV